MKLPLPVRSSGPRSPRCDSNTPRSIGGQSPSEAYFNSNTGLVSPSTAYFEGTMNFFGQSGGQAHDPSTQTAERPAPPAPMEQAPSHPPQQKPPTNAPVPQAHPQQPVGMHSMPFVTYPPSSSPASTMPWPTVTGGGNPPALSIPNAGPTLLQGAGAPSLIQKQPPPQKPPTLGRQKQGSDSRSQSNRATCPAAVYVDLSSLREKK